MEDSELIKTIKSIRLSWYLDDGDSLDSNVSQLEDKINEIIDTVNEIVEKLNYETH